MNLAQALKSEMQRLARKEVKALVGQTKKQVAEQRRTIATLKRENSDLQKRLAFLEGREKKRLKSAPAAKKVPDDARFSVRSLKSQRRKTGLSQADYAKLLGVSTITMNNWENGKNRPRDAQFAKIYVLRGLGKREAEKRLAVLFMRQSSD